MTRRARRRRIFPAVVAMAAALALAIPASSAASAPWKVKLVVGNHSPRTCTPWHITIRASKGRRKLNGQVEYYYFTAAEDNAGHLGANQPAGTAANGYGDFSGGIFRDTIVLPSRYAEGVPLDFNAVVRTSYGTQTASAVITPRHNRRQCA